MHPLSCGLGDLVVHRLEHLVLPLLVVDGTTPPERGS
jgi:hypothetical protein